MEIVYSAGLSSVADRLIEKIHALRLNMSRLKRKRKTLSSV